MKQNRVYFVRHAEPNYKNHNDRERELSLRGMADRELVTRFFSDKCIDIVLSSPYKRAIDTVKPFADSQGLAIETVEDFRERKVDACWIEDFSEFTRRQWRDFGYKLSDGECLREVQERNISALKTVLHRYSGKNIIIGSHGTALSTVINYFDHSFGYDDFEKIKNIMPWIVEFEFDDDFGCVGIKQIDLRQYNS